MPITNPDHLCINCMREKVDNGVCPFCGFDEAQYEPSPHHLPPKNILGGKYLIGRVLGEGGFGITYLGWDLNLDLKLAIKEYYPTGYVTRTGTSTNTVTPYRGEKTEFFTSGRARFINEAKTLAKFYALPGIVSVRDFFLENGTAYIVMEFVEGETFKQRLSRVGGKMAPGEVFDLMRPLLRSLAQMHASGLIHRDISPDNIMITPEGNVKLIDFGAARDYLDSGNRSLSVMLKPGYAPEEQYFARGQQGPWTDIYALCATIYRAITGITPPESVERLRNDELKAPSTLGVAISPAQEAALLRGLSVSQEDRWQTVIALYDAFYPKQTPAVVPTGKNPKTTHRPNTTKAKQTQASSKRKPAAANTIRQWSMQKRIAVGAASLVLVCAAAFFAGAALYGDDSQNSFWGKVLSLSSANEHARGKESGASATSLPIKQDVSAVTSPATNTPVVATPTQAPTATAKPTPTAKPTATPKKEGDAQEAPAPVATAAQNAATSAPVVTAASRATPTPAVKATSTPTSSTATAWTSWSPSLPGGLNEPAYTVQIKDQYRTVTYVYYESTQYRFLIQTEDGEHWTDWDVNGTAAYFASNVISTETRTIGNYDASYGSWIDGTMSRYTPNMTEPINYEGIDVRTVYRYKHN